MPTAASSSALAFDETVILLPPPRSLSTGSEIQDFRGNKRWSTSISMERWPTDGRRVLADPLHARPSSSVATAALIPRPTDA